MNKARRLYGYFVLISNEVKDPIEALHLLIYLLYIKEQMQKHDLFSKYTMQSLLDELDVIECFTEPGKAPMQGEVLKKQEDLFVAMGVMPLYAKHSVEIAGIQVSRVAVGILAITGIICLSLDQYAVHKHQIDLYHTAFYYHNSLSV